MSARKLSSIRHKYIHCIFCPRAVYPPGPSPFQTINHIFHTKLKGKLLNVNVLFTLVLSSKS